MMVSPYLFGWQGCVFERFNDAPIIFTLYQPLNQVSKMSSAITVD
jgi:hypothetical protein